MDDLGAVLDAPTEIAEPVESAIDETTEETPESTEVPAEIEGNQPNPAIDEKLPLWKQAKDDIAAIQAKNPTLAAKIKAALIADSQTQQQLPEGVKAAAALRTAVTQLADPGSENKTPDQILSETMQERAYFRELDRQFTEGDPAFPTKLAEASPESFQKLAPAFFDKFGEVNPEGYAAYVTQAVVGHMNQSEVPISFRILQTFLPQLPDGPAKDQVIDAFNRIYGWTETIRGMAGKPIVPEIKKPETNPDLEQREQALRDQEIDLTRQQWNAATISSGMNLFNAELTKVSGKTVLTDEQKREILGKVSEELDARLAANKDYGQAMRSFLQNKNAEGYKRRLNSERVKLMPGAVRRAYDDVMEQAPKPQQKTNVASQKPQTQRTANTEGWKRVSSYPSGQVDVRKTTPAMTRENKAILKDGSKVQYPGFAG